MIKDGKFRPDLYYRLNILYLYLPPLRERREDIPLLIRHYLDHYGRQLGKENLHLSAGAEGILLQYDYPGNIRELDNIILRSLVMAEDEEVELRHLPESVVPCESETAADQQNFSLVKKAVIERFERDYLETTLERAHGIVAQAAKIAGIDAKNFYQKMQKYQIKASHR